MNNTPVAPFLAIFIGAGLGFGLCFVGQRLMNEYYKDSCSKKPEHVLVLGHGFFGDTYYCTHRQYVNNEPFE